MHITASAPITVSVRIACDDPTVTPEELSAFIEAHDSETHAAIEAVTRKGSVAVIGWITDNADVYAYEMQDAHCNPHIGPVQIDD